MAELAKIGWGPAKKKTPSGRKDMFLEGKNIFLRGLEARDLHSRYVRWLNDPEVNLYMATRRFPTTLEDLQRFYERIKADPQAVYFAICLKGSGRHIGNIKLDKIDWINRTAEFGLLIGDKQHWRRGLGSEATYLITKHGFRHLNLQRITIFLAAGNQGALRCYVKAGYRQEGLLRRAAFLNGGYQDVVAMGQFQEEFRVRTEYEP